MKTLIVYFSFSGNNELLAKELRNTLNCDLYPVRELKKRAGISIFLDILFKRTPAIKKPDINLADYDHMILVSPVWAGRIANPLKSFIKLKKEQIADYSFISLCGAGGNKDLEAELRRLTGKKPIAVCELAVRDLLPVEKKDKVKYTSGYKVQLQDLKPFKKAIDRFLVSALQSKVRGQV